MGKVSWEKSRDKVLSAGKGEEIGPRHKSRNTPRWIPEKRIRLRKQTPRVSVGIRGSGDLRGLGTNVEQPLGAGAPARASSAEGTLRAPAESGGWAGVRHFNSCVKRRPQQIRC
ncbi:hypothetical protein Y1Q_0020999 [Alligator mississippiensis]|uniref:Uncharacterized protein n=1 Tax=Alligator mississippiensis TaxID=8496 RepID=A0A151MTN6_ALLMI|nr:hypothetical protein Y1Q_0020999 [Alligator mississippiensis]